jgi:hypothetical protein
MQWLLFILGLAAVWFAALAVINRRSRARRYHVAMEVWRRAKPGGRAAAMQTLLNDQPINGPASFMLACTLLREGRAREAAREFGAAYHADCNLESAALLTFACLKSKDGLDGDIVQPIVQTWREMKRPDLFANWEDRSVLSALEVVSDPAPTSLSLGKFIWIVLGPAHSQRAAGMAIAEGQAAAPKLELNSSPGLNQAR